LRNKLRTRTAKLVRDVVSLLPMQSRVERLLQGQQQQINELKAEVSELKVVTDQLSFVIREGGGLLPPPKKLRERVVGRDFSNFLESGEATVSDLDKILRPTGRSLKSFETVLDFGAGCARVLRALRAHVGPSNQLYGTDIDSEAVQWCCENYSSVAVFEINEVLPPLRYADNSFDFIYCISVFTHLPEDMQFIWLEELNRILRPGGYLIISTHGEFYYDRISRERISQLRANGFLYFNNGVTEGLPDFYLTAYHTHEYIREHWSPHLDIIGIEPRALLGRQDAVISQKRSERSSIS
jgi:ubiquinone/menaquinone biosynthesis C-methylase UbiE